MSAAGATEGRSFWWWTTVWTPIPIGSRWPSLPLEAVTKVERSSRTLALVAVDVDVIVLLLLPTRTLESALSCACWWAVAAAVVGGGRTTSARSANGVDRAGLPVLLLRSRRSAFVAAGVSATDDDGGGGGGDGGGSGGNGNRPRKPSEIPPIIKQIITWANVLQENWLDHTQKTIGAPPKDKVKKNEQQSSSAKWIHVQGWA